MPRERNLRTFASLYRTLLLALVTATAVGSTSALAQKEICVSAIEGSTSDGPPLRPVLAAGAPVTQILGMTTPIVTPQGWNGRWRINRSHQLVPYEDFWPIESYLDANHQVVEPWSSRVVAATWGYGRLSVLEPGTDRFVLIGQGYSQIPFPSLRLSKTFVIDDKNGVTMALEGSSLRPWVSQDELRAHAVPGVGAFFDSSVLDASVVLQRDHMLSVRTEDGHWYRLASLDKWEFGSLFDAPKSNAAVYLGQKAVIAIRRLPGGFVAETLLSKDNNSTSQMFFKSGLLGELLYFGKKGLFDFREPRWLRLSSTGFKDLGDIPTNLPAGIAGYPSAAVHDLPTLKKMVIESDRSLLLYDGESLVEVPDTDRLRLGRRPMFFDLPSIGRVIVSTEWGLFELTRDARLRELNLPPVISNWMYDWPAANAAMTWTRRGIQLFNQNMSFKEVALLPLSDQATIYSVSPPNPRTGEVFVSSSEGLLVLSVAEHGVCFRPGRPAPMR
jgi:hypothetical protein